MGSRQTDRANVGRQAQDVGDLPVLERSDRDADQPQPAVWSRMFSAMCPAFSKAERQPRRWPYRAAPASGWAARTGQSRAWPMQGWCMVLAVAIDRRLLLATGLAQRPRLAGDLLLDLVEEPRSADGGAHATGITAVLEKHDDGSLRQRQS